jgi:hypothetical protein
VADLSSVAKAFEQFAVDCRDSSPIYERLSLAIIGDEQLLALAARVGRKQPIPNLLFAAVRFLQGDVSSFDAFRAFCLKHAPEIRNILETRNVQTNEVGRCAYLVPAFVIASAAFQGRPLAVTEVGTSAGLLLNWDLYGYRYSGVETTIGDSNSPVQVQCELRGNALPPLPNTMPALSSKLGIDLHFIDLSKENERRWLQSLVWPEHQDRANLLAAAIEVQRQHPVRSLNGDGLTLLPDVLAGISRDSIACVFHTAVLNQFPREDRVTFSNLLADCGGKRDLVWISGEMARGAPSIVQLEITTWLNANRHHQVLARAHPHGRWLDWVASANY